jgi:hypothetical protein
MKLSDMSGFLRVFPQKSSFTIKSFMTLRHQSCLLISER